MFTGPNIIKDKLTVNFDVANLKSFKGEATTNLIPNPTINALPTFGNSWGTYNTNQYCGNNGCNIYWDLPSISSVSNNVITTSSAHTLRTYDVINPQNTGGGVNAGQQYFVKVISSTQFTLHDYNGSQDGSQGYVNTSTGGFKVHDSVLFDQRVSVNASGFPTKWFGNPHQPNSGLVKEIIVNGYKTADNKYTDCIRLHVPRPNGVDGMAYGSDATVVIGQPVTTSFWYRSISQSAVGRNVNFQHYNYGGIEGANGFYGNFELGKVGEWKRFTMTFTPTHSVLISYWFPQGDYIYDFDIANIQIEQKNTASFFIAGTRGNTVSTGGGLADLSGLFNNGTLVNGPIYSSVNNGVLTFDGVDDYVSIPNITLGNGDKPWSVGAWVKTTTTVNGLGDGSILSNSSSGPVYSMMGVNNGRVVYWTYQNNAWSQKLGTKVVNDDKWHYLTWVNYNYTMYMYVDGILDTFVPNSTSGNNNPIDIMCGSWAGRFSGQISGLEIMNGNVLQPSDVLQNYNAKKGRFL
jgi:hypothetical protein